MPRFLLVMFAILLTVQWSLALFGPEEARDVFIGGAQGSTIAAVVMIALAELAVWIRKPPWS